MIKKIKLLAMAAAIVLCAAGFAGYKSTWTEPAAKEETSSTEQVTSATEQTTIADGDISSDAQKSLSEQGYLDGKHAITYIPNETVTDSSTPSASSSSSKTIAGDASGMDKIVKNTWVQTGVIDENGTFLNSDYYFTFKDLLEKDGYKFTGEVPTTPPQDTSSNNSSSSNSSGNSSGSGHDDGNGNWVGGGTYSPLTQEEIEALDKALGDGWSSDGGKTGRLREWTEEEMEYYSRGGNGGYH